ncbi:elongation factor 4 [Patescibacteria group bacterium]|nr:elongation factor 4 [Patescibacteria group bacterium]
MNIRNFVIISHIDHGKSTLADRFLELTETVEKRKMRAQYLDAMDLERERGITIKMQPVRMKYASNGVPYTLNLIDTPGHIDFSYEVSRALAAVEGAILLVDGTQGIEAQTLSVLDMARGAGLVIIPVVNKIDLPHAQIEETKKEIKEVLDVDHKDILEISAKTGQGIEKLFEAVIEKIPFPNPKSDLGQALVFDSQYSSHQGVIVYVRVFGDRFKKGEAMQLVSTGEKFICQEVGIFSPERKQAESLEAGEIGYLVTNIKKAEGARVGDTVILQKSPALSLKGYQCPQPMIWSSIYPLEEDNFDDLKKAISRLHLSDSSFSYEEESSSALGRGFRVGCLGLLHLEILMERLKREFGVGVIAATPTVAYDIILKNGLQKVIYNPAEFPEDHEIEKIKERWVNLKSIVPSGAIGAVLKLLQSHEGVVVGTEAFGDFRSIIKAEMPLRELMRDFFDELKSVTRGYASLSYELGEMRSSSVIRLDVLVHAERVGAFSRIVSKKIMEREAKRVVERLYSILPKEQFSVKIQAQAGGRILAARTLSAFRKDVTGYLYGGDRTRKMKLWKKQKKGKKRLKEMGRVSIGPEVFIKMIHRS